MKLKTLFAAAIVAIAIKPATALALPIYLNDSINGFIAHYNSVQPNVGDVMGSCFSCNICHTGVVANSTNLSQYAMDWRNAWVARESARFLDEPPNANSVAAFSDIESMQSDGDGINNITEIKAGSNPGNTASTPTNPGCSSGGGSISYNSTNGSQWNANALNSKCGFSGSIDASDKGGHTKQAMQELLMFLMPLMLGVLLRFKVSH